MLCLFPLFLFSLSLSLFVWSRDSRVKSRESTLGAGLVFCYGMAMHTDANMVNFHIVIMHGVNFIYRSVMHMGPAACTSVCATVLTGFSPRFTLRCSGVGCRLAGAGPRAGGPAAGVPKVQPGR